MPSIGRLQKYIEPSHIDQVSYCALDYGMYLFVWGVKYIKTGKQQLLKWLVIVFENNMFIRLKLLWFLTDLDDTCNVVLLTRLDVTAEFGKAVRSVCTMIPWSVRYMSK